jgi:hypothetical protein|tara:strand:- start:6427 stop:6810 length:384 start_codon:yes stop_codon:yes gene_type:complete
MRAHPFERAVDLVDRFVERRCAGRQSDGVDVIEPVGVQLIRAFDVQRRGPMLVAELHQLVSVVRVASADDYDRGHTLYQVEDGVQPKPGGLADRIDHAYVGEWIALLDARADGGDEVRGRGGLGHDA